MSAELTITFTDGEIELLTAAAADKAMDVTAFVRLVAIGTGHRLNYIRDRRNKYGGGMGDAVVIGRDKYSL